MPVNIPTHKKKAKGRRVLIVTPEVTYLPHGMGNMSNHMRAKAGGLADVSATLVTELHKRGIDVHVALPHYRKMFNVYMKKMVKEDLRMYLSNLSNKQVHLAEDRAFYYCDSVYSNYGNENYKIALSFQREVINNIIPAVKPDLIHCNDWMTGLIPAYAKRVGIPCLFTIHNIHSSKITMDVIEDRGIDAAEFWENFYFSNVPHSYEESRSTNPVDMLNTGIFASSYINTVSPSFLDEIARGQHEFVPPATRHEIYNKHHKGFAKGILNAPNEKDHPTIDDFLELKYDEQNYQEGKRANKIHFQKCCGLDVNPEAPILFWPSRLDPVQKGCQLLADILYHLIDHYKQEQLQLAIVANGSFQSVFKDIVNFHHLHGKVAVLDFDEKLSHLGFAGSDFVLMPSRFEPCGLPQMIAPKYGTLPIVHATGGLRDTVEHLDAINHRGNGFVFQHYDSNALWWAIDQAMQFYRQDTTLKNEEIRRIMKESQERFNHENTAVEYIDLYREILRRCVD